MRISEYAKAFKGGASAENIFPRVTWEAKHGPDARRAQKWAEAAAKLERVCGGNVVTGWVHYWPYPDLPWPGLRAVKVYCDCVSIENDSDGQWIYPRYWLISLADGHWKKWHKLAPRRWHIIRVTRMRGWVAQSFYKGGAIKSIKPRQLSWTLPRFSPHHCGYENSRNAIEAVNAAAKHGWKALEKLE